MSDFDQLLDRIRKCQICSDLPLGANPIIKGKESAKILIIGQAPGTFVHKSSIPWDDKSGQRLRQWLNMTSDQFYDESTIAIMPMGLCYPGKMNKGGDKPPRKECAPQWHKLVLDQLINLELTLLVGSYAQNYYLGKNRHQTMAENIADFQTFMKEGFFPLPHPSWRVTIWSKENPWFEKEVIPALQHHLEKILR